MKKSASFCLLAALLSGCAANKRTYVLNPVPVGQPIDELHNIRNEPQYKAYQLGRRIDPADPSIMHEGHIVYVRETGPTWNLFGKEPAQISKGPAEVASPNAPTPAPSAKELLLLLNERRRIDQTITNQSAELQRLVTGVSSMMPLLQRFATQASQNEIQLRNIEDRLRTIENKGGSNSVPLTRWPPVFTNASSPTGPQKTR